MFDYQFRIKVGERTAETTYQALVKLLELADESCAGAPMEEGGAPQALALKTAIERAVPEMGVEVWFQGAQLF